MHKHHLALHGDGLSGYANGDDPPSHGMSSFAGGDDPPSHGLGGAGASMPMMKAKKSAGKAMKLDPNFGARDVGGPLTPQHGCSSYHGAGSGCSCGCK